MSADSSWSASHFYHALHDDCVPQQLDRRSCHFATSTDRANPMLTRVHQRGGGAIVVDVTVTTDSGSLTPVPVTWVGPAKNSARRRTLALTALLLANTLPPLDPILNSVLLPLAAEDLDMSTSEYALAAGLESMVVVAAILAAGTLGDRLGRRRLLISGLACFAFGELITSFAPNVNVFLLGRAITGLGAGCVFSMAFGMLAALYFPRERPRIFGIAAATIALMTAFTLIVGGTITTVSGSWREGYLVRPILAIIVLILVALFVPRSRAKAQGKLDLIGVITAGLGLVMLVLGLSSAGEYSWLSLHTLVPLALAALLLTAFVFQERRLKDPSFPIRLYRRPDFVSGNFLLFGLNFGVGALTVLTAQLLQEAMGWSAERFGRFSLTIVVGEIIGSLVAGRFLRKTGKFQVTTLASAILVAVGCGLLATLSDPISDLQLALGLGVIGVGLMAGVVTANTVLMDDAPADKLGSVAAVPPILADVALGVGLALLLPLMASVAGGDLSSGDVPAIDQLAGFSAAMWVTAATVLVLGVASFLLMMSAKRKGLMPGAGHVQTH